MMHWAESATTVNRAEHEPPSAIAAPASTTTPHSLRGDEPRWERAESLLALSSTTARDVIVAIRPLPPSRSVNELDALDVDDDFEVAPAATVAVPKAVFRMRGRIVRVTRPVYEAAGVPASDDILDDE